MYNDDIESLPALRRGSRGGDMKRLEWKLIDDGIDPPEYAGQKLIGSNWGGTLFVEIEAVEVEAMEQPRCNGMKLPNQHILYLTPQNIIKTIVECGDILDLQNISEDGRWMKMPLWAWQLIEPYDLKPSGRRGMIDRFVLDVDNDTPESLVFSSHHSSFVGVLLVNLGKSNPPDFDEWNW
jgi:hypothetical protein